MVRRQRRRVIWLAAAIAAAISGVVTMFWRSGTCTDFVAAESTCTVAPSLTSILMAAILWGMAAWFFSLWWRGAPHA